MHALTGGGWMVRVRHLSYRPRPTINMNHTRAVQHSVARSKYGLYMQRIFMNIHIHFLMKHIRKRQNCPRCPIYILKVLNDRNLSTHTRFTSNACSHPISHLKMTIQSLHLVPPKAVIKCYFQSNCRKLRSSEV